MASDRPPIARRTLARQPAPAGIYAGGFTVERAALICRRVAAGESLRAICDRDPAMPTGKTVWNWRRSVPGFDAMLSHAQSVARARSLAAQAERDTAARTAREATRKFAGRAPSRFSPVLWEAILTRLSMGEALTAICREPAMPAIGTVYHWLRTRPELVAAYRHARSLTPEFMLELAMDRLTWPGIRGSEPQLRRTEKALARAAARLKLKRYAPRAGSETVQVLVEDADGGVRVLYDGGEP